jgi:16S rRNA (uracil1498-N3)-methyltransferase
LSRTPRIFVDQALAEGLELRPDDQALRHLTRVLRLRSGAPVRVFDGRGHEHAAVLLSGDAGPFLRLSEPVEPTAESPLRICLLQGISRGDRMDLVIQKATELGVAEIRPVATRRSVVRLDGQRARQRTEHWWGIAVAACEQCGRATLPVLHAPTGLAAAMQALPADAIRWILDSGGNPPSSTAISGNSDVALLLGPEGGLTGAEKNLAADLGFSPVSLGPRTMRTETAAIAVIAIVQAIWGDLSASP